MSRFEEYSEKYRFIKLERREGILQMTLHTDGGPLRWGLEAQGECAQAFADVGADLENRQANEKSPAHGFSGRAPLGGLHSGIGCESSRKVLHN